MKLSVLVCKCQNKHGGRNLPGGQFVTLIISHWSYSTESSISIGKNEKINHLFLDDLNLNGINEKKAEILTNTVSIFTKDIELQVPGNFGSRFHDAGKIP